MIKNFLLFVFRLLFGRRPTTLQISLTLLFGFACAYGIYILTDGSSVLAFSAFDICGGIITNACRSTRRFWAELPKFVVPLFVVFHLLEIPHFWMSTHGNMIFWVLCAAMSAKLAVFLLGQQEYRL